MWKLLGRIIARMIAVATAVISLMGFFLGITSYRALEQFIIDINGKTLSEENYKSVIAGLVVLGVLTLIIFIVQLVVYFLEAQKAKKEGESLHDFHHNIRDEIFDMIKAINNRTYTDSAQLYKYISTECEMLGEYIFNFFKEKNGKEFSISIKALVTPKDENGVPMTNSSRYYTLCRSGKNKEKRTKQALKRANKEGKAYYSERQFNYSVDQNTAFERIMTNFEGHTVFQCSNLIMVNILNRILPKERISPKDRYLNPNNEFQKSYLSTVVVPIRIHGAYLEIDETDLDNSYVAYGFLCIDYRWPISKALINEIVEYTSGFADAFFNLFYVVDLCNKNIEERQQKLLENAGR